MWSPFCSWLSDWSTNNSLVLQPWGLRTRAHRDSTTVAEGRCQHQQEGYLGCSAHADCRREGALGIVPRWRGWWGWRWHEKNLTKFEPICISVIICCISVILFSKTIYIAFLYSIEMYRILNLCQSIYVPIKGQPGSSCGVLIAEEYGSGYKYKAWIKVPGPHTIHTPWSIPRSIPHDTAWSIPLIHTLDPYPFLLEERLMLALMLLFNLILLLVLVLLLPLLLPLFLLPPPLPPLPPLAAAAAAAAAAATTSHLPPRSCCYCCRFCCCSCWSSRCWCWFTSSVRFW